MTCFRSILLLLLSETFNNYHKKANEIQIHSSTFRQSYGTSPYNNKAVDANIPIAEKFNDQVLT